MKSTLVRLRWSVLLGGLVFAPALSLLAEEKATEPPATAPAAAEAAGGEKNAEKPPAERLELKLEPGARAAYRVTRGHHRTGRFPGGDRTVIDYSIRVRKARKELFELGVTYDRIRFKRTGRAELEFDSEDPPNPGAPLLESLRDMVGKTAIVTVDRHGTVRKVERYPAPELQIRNRVPGGEGEPKKGEAKGEGGAEPDPERGGHPASEPKGGDGAGKTEGRRAPPSRRELILSQVRRMAARLVKFVVSEESLRLDLQTILAAGLQEQPLEPGERYRIVRPVQEKKPWRHDHPGPVEIRSAEGRGEVVARPNPLSGTAPGGRGDFALEFTRLGEVQGREFCGFRLFPVPVYGAAKKGGEPVGLATFRKSDGMLQKLSYRYEAGQQVVRDRYFLVVEIEITGK